jgi:hypothetical protein
MSKLGLEVLSKGHNWATLPCFNQLFQALVFSLGRFWSMMGSN